MAKRCVTLTFNPETIAEPIIYNLGHQFNVVTNIRRASMTEARGWIELDLEGEDKDIDDGIAWITSKGARVDPSSNEMAET